MFLLNFAVLSIKMTPGHEKNLQNSFYDNGLLSAGRHVWLPQGEDI